MYKFLISLIIIISIGSTCISENLPQSIMIDLPNISEEALTLEMTLIPSGTFIMGTDKEKYFYDEYPPHSVKITQPFYMSKTEITLAQWVAVMNYNPLDSNNINKDFFEHINKPVVLVSWHECQNFIQKLNELDLGTFRLPTEAEWEYACRAGTSTDYYWGKNVDDWIDYEQHNSYPYTSLVGLKSPNKWNLYDMTGNIREWCNDWYRLHYLTGNPIDPKAIQIDPKGPYVGSEKVVRGGYVLNSSEIHSSARSSLVPTYVDEYIGFRIVRNATNNIRSVKVYDDANSTTDLTGGDDWDEVINRALYITWEGIEKIGSGWDIYVREGWGGYQFLKRNTLDEMFFLWKPNFNGVNNRFSTGPKFNTYYQFRILRLDWPINNNDIVEQSIPVGYNYAGDYPVDKTIPDPPNLNPGEIHIYDDLLGGNNLAPLSNIGKDIDDKNHRALQIAWQFEDNDAIDYHIMISVNDSDYAYLGNTNSGEIPYYYWSNTGTFAVANDFASGPQNGNIYQFQVIKLNFNGTKETLISGKIKFMTDK